MERMMLGILFFALSGVFLGEHEQITNDLGNFGVHNGTWFPKWRWWNSSNWRYKNPFMQWLMRYPFSFLKDGYHLTVSLGRVFAIAGGSVFVGASVEKVLISVFVGYVVLGIAFNISYHN